MSDESRNESFHQKFGDSCDLLEKNKNDIVVIIVTQILTSYRIEKSYSLKPVKNVDYSISTKKSNQDSSTKFQN